jgi:hypothetical protein
VIVKAATTVGDATGSNDFWNNSKLLALETRSTNDGSGARAIWAEEKLENLAPNPQRNC